MELILGSGARKFKRCDYYNDIEDVKTCFSDDVITLDINEELNPDIVWDLNNLPLPLDDNKFDEIHAYEVLEHIAYQGDYKSFFHLFNELYRILKKDGFIFISVPVWNSLWGFGDPGHTRIINIGTIVFLSQKQYEKQVGKTPMTDYRNIYKGDFDILKCIEDEVQLNFLLKKV